MEGTEFWIGFMDNRNLLETSNDDSLALRLLVTARQATSGTVSIPHLNWYHNFIVESDSTLEIVIPADLARHPYFNISEKKGIHLVSGAPVSVSAYNYMPYSLDGSPVYPVSMLGSEYYLASYAPYMGSYITGKSEFLIVATEDSTVIEITPKVALVGRAANVMYSIVLNKGETYQNSATSIYADVSGTLVKGAAINGTCKPFAVFSGSQSAYVPSNCWFADHLYEQLAPTNSWGTQFFIPPFALMSQYTLNIIAKTNNTVVTLNPITGTSVTLSQGQSYKFSPGGDRVITSTKPVSVFMFMEGEECNGGSYGDPAMLAVNSSDQAINYSKFATYNDFSVDTHYVNLVVKTPERHTIYLDDTLIPDNLFAPFTAYPSMSYARIPVSAGSHELKSENSFQGLVYGFGFESYTSYANNLGWYEPVQVPQMEQLICTDEDTLLTAPTGLSDVWWSTLSYMNDTLGTGQDFLVAAAEPGNTYVAHGTVASGCISESYFSVENPATANASITASGTTACNFTGIEVGISSDITGVPFSTEWSPGEQFEDPFSDSTTLTPEASGWYYATVTSFAPGCYTLKDSVYITLNGGDITETEISAAKGLLCFNDTTTLELSAYRKVGFDNFNGQTNATLWSQVNGAVTDNTCGSHNGDALYFNGASLRSIETVPLDLSAGGKISFYLKTGSAASSCDNPEPGDNILLQYSLDNGATWTTFRTLYEYYYSTFLPVEEEIPAAAFSGSTKIRLTQPVFSGLDQDLWMLDQFLISRKDVAGPVSWSPNSFITAANSYTTQVYPPTTTAYSVSLIDQGCTYTDSILILSDNFSATIEDLVSCDSPAVTLIAHVSDNDSYWYSWQSNANADSPDDSIFVVGAQVVSDTFTVGILSAEGCRLSESIAVAPQFFEIEILGDTIICAGDTADLVADAFLTISDNFNSQTVNDNLWWNVSGGFISNNCSVYDGSNLYFGDGTNRSCETRSFDFSNGGILSFEYAFGWSTGYYPNSCSLPAANQSIKIEYSLDNGLSWTPIISLGPGNTPIFNTDFTHVNIEIPPGAYSSATKFRWKQNSISDQYGSNWMLDDVSLMRRLPGTNSYSWYDAQNNLIASDSLLTIAPNTTSSYTVQIHNAQSNCTRSRSVTVKTGQPYSLNLSDIELCSAETVTLTPQPPAGEDYNFKWRFYESWPYPIYTNSSTDSTYTIYAGSPAMVVVHSSSPSGCSTIDTIDINLLFDFEQATILGDTAICTGGSGELEAKLVEEKLYPCESTLEFQSFSGVQFSSNYGAINGDALFFMGSLAGPREIVINRPIPNGGSISFYFKSGDGINANATEPGDDLLLEYSTDNGTSWQFMANLPTYQVFQYEFFTMDFPAAANSPATLIRLSQTSFNGAWSDIIMIDEITVSTYSGVPLNYSWTSNSTVIATTADVSISPTGQSQSYSVTMSDLGGVCTFSDTITVETFDFSVDAGSDTTICNNAVISLNGSTDCSSPYTVSWTNPGNLSSDTILQPQVISNVSADYILSVTKHNCQRLDTVSVAVLPNLQLTLADSLLKCAQDTLFVNMDDATAITWTPTTDIINNPGNTFGFYTGQENNYLVSYLDTNGCSYLDSMHISVQTPVLVTLSSDTTICDYDELLLVPQSGIMDSAFIWSDGSISGSLLVSNPGIYWAEQFDGCSTSRDSIVVSNFPPLNPTIVNLDNVLSVNESFQTYQWIDCNKDHEPVAGETNPAFTPAANGSYAVVVSSDGSCTDTSGCFTIDYLGLDNLVSANGLYLNYYSLKNELIVVFTDGDKHALELFDYSGKLVYKKEEVISGEAIHLDNYAAGIYTVRIAEQTRRIYIR